MPSIRPRTVRRRMMGSQLVLYGPLHQRVSFTLCSHSSAIYIETAIEIRSITYRASRAAIFPPLHRALQKHTISGFRRCVCRRHSPLSTIGDFKPFQTFSPCCSSFPSDYKFRPPIALFLPLNMTTFTNESRITPIASSEKGNSLHLF